VSSAAARPIPQNRYQAGTAAPRANAAPRISSLEKNPDSGGTPAIARVAIHITAHVHGR